MATVEEHYEKLLARHYSWLWGGFSAKAADNEGFFKRLGVRPQLSGNGVDLGCGSGFQSVPLAKAGFSVTAIDVSDTLLGELAAHAKGLDVVAVRGDMLDLAVHCSRPVELVVCMGDTLTHLPDEKAVDELFLTVFQTLEPGGRFILTYRDLSFELTGLDRFIPVRSDADKVFTCFLEYQDNTVTVHDLVNVRCDDGWRLEKSCYSKLRLPVDVVVEKLQRAGFTMAVREVEQGLATLVANK